MTMGENSKDSSGLILNIEEDDPGGGFEPHGGQLYLVKF